MPLSQVSLDSAEFHAYIEQLWVYPLKSCAGISLPEAVLTDKGLAWDRAWMVVDVAGEMVTQRELPRMALIQPALTPHALVLQAPQMVALSVSLHVPTTTPVRVRVWDDEVPAFDMGDAASGWLTACLGSGLGSLRLVRFDERHARQSSNKWTHGLPAFNQFSDGFPVLVTSMASLHELNTRLTAQGVAAVDMRRFRANVVLGDAPGYALLPHDEDRVGVMTVVGEGEPVQLQPVKPCARCPIPNIDPDTALAASAVGDTLQSYRQDARVKGGITFGMNAITLSGVGQVLRVGQTVSANWTF